MESKGKIEQLFQVLDRSSTYIAQYIHKSYLEALIDTVENMIQGEIVHEASEEQRNKLQDMYQALELEAYSKEERRRAFQLVMLKGLKEQTLPGTGMTPDTVTMLIAYLAKQLVEDPVRIIDPAVGSGNLLSCVLNQFEHEVSGFGTEVEGILVRLAYMNMNLQHHDVELYHQDGLKTLFSSQSDLLVCDLPVGRYPNLKVAEKFQLYKEDEDPFTHHLLIEQSIQMVRDGGYLMFLIPNSLFVEPGSDRLRHLITEKTYIQMVLQLPDQLFQEGSIHKSIFILQKKGDDSRKPKETLMASLPNLSQASSVSKVVDHIREWISREKM